MTKKRWSLFFVATFMSVFAIIYFIPVYSFIIISLKPTREVIFTPLAFPKSLYLDNFKKAWTALNFSVVYINSIIITVTSVVLRIILASMASFVLAKKASKFNRFLYLFFIAGLMIPIYTVLVPLVRLIKDLGLMNSRSGLIVFYIASGMPFAIFLLTGFIKRLPNALIEAAIIDGASVHRVMWQIVFPLLKPVVSTLFILDFLAIWNDFLFPMLTLSDSTKKTVTVAMYNFYGEFGTRWEMTFAGYTLAVIPLVIIYLLLQKNIVNGILVGAVKG